MASELSRLIEDELKNRGYNVDDDKNKKPKSKKPQAKDQVPDDEEAQPLVGGTMSIESRSNPSPPKSFFTAKKVLAVAGTIFVILVVALVLTIKFHGSNAAAVTVASLSPPPSVGASNSSRSDGMSDVKEAEEFTDGDHPMRGTEDYENSTETGSVVPPSPGTKADAQSPPSPVIANKLLPPSPPMDAGNIVNDPSTGTQEDNDDEDEEDDELESELKEIEEEEEKAGKDTDTKTPAAASG